MPFIFHEGLPRSGKSYSAIKDWIIPALLKGRHVYAYIEGLNHAKIAEVAGMDVVKVVELLHQLVREDVPTIYDKVKPDSLVIIDELQNFWPTTREKLRPEMIQFITEHGHLGLDIVCMGQALNDCHAMWRRRMAQKVYFLKLDARGKVNSFKTTVFKPVPTDKGELKWEEVTSTTEDYDPKYFGTYKSHTDETTNKETLVDKRAIIWNHPMFRRYLPIFAAVLCVAIYYLWGFFHGGFAKSVIKNQPQAQQQNQPVAKTQPVNHQSQNQPVVNAAKSDDVPTFKTPMDTREFKIPEPPPDMVDELSQKYRLRFVGYMRNRDKMIGMVEWRNDGFGVVEQLTFNDLKTLGWQVMTGEDNNITVISKYSRRYIATAWPLPDPQGKVPDATQQTLKPKDQLASAI